MNSSPTSYTPSPCGRSTNKSEQRGRRGAEMNSSQASCTPSPSGRNTNKYEHRGHKGGKAGSSSPLFSTSSRQESTFSVPTSSATGPMGGGKQTTDKQRPVGSRSSRTVQNTHGPKEVIAPKTSHGKAGSSSILYSIASNLDSSSSVPTSATGRMSGAKQTTDEQRTGKSRRSRNVQNPCGGKDVTAPNTARGSYKMERSSTMSESPRKWMTGRQNSVDLPSKSIVSSTCASGRVAKGVLKGTEQLINARMNSSSAFTVRTRPIGPKDFILNSQPRKAGSSSILYSTASNLDSTSSVPTSSTGRMSGAKQTTDEQRPGKSRRSRNVQNSCGGKDVTAPNTARGSYKMERSSTMSESPRKWMTGRQKSVDLPSKSIASSTCVLKNTEQLINADEASTSTMVTPAATHSIEKSGKETHDEGNLNAIKGCTTCITYPPRSNRGGRGSNRGSRMSFAPPNISDEAATSTMVTPETTHTIEKSGKETHDEANLSGVSSGSACIIRPTRSNRGRRGSTRGSHTSFAPTNISGETDSSSAVYSTSSSQGSNCTVSTSATEGKPTTAKQRLVNLSSSPTAQITHDGKDVIAPKTISGSYPMQRSSTMFEIRKSTAWVIDIVEAPTSSMVTPAATHSMEKSGKETNDKAILSGSPSSRVMREDTHTIEKSGKETIKEAPFSYVTCVTYPNRSNRGGRGSNGGSRTSFASTNISGAMSLSSAYSSTASVVTSSSSVISDATTTGTESDFGEISRNTPIVPRAIGEADSSSAVNSTSSSLGSTSTVSTSATESVGAGKPTTAKQRLVNSRSSPAQITHDGKEIISPQTLSTETYTSPSVVPEDTHTIEKSSKETIEEAPFSYITCVTHPKRSNRGGRGSNRGSRTSLAPSNIHGEMSSSPAYSSMTSVVTSSPISEGTRTGLQTGCDDIYETTPRNTPVGTNASTETPTSSMVTPAATHGMEKSGKETNDKANLSGLTSARVMPEDTQTIQKSGKETIEAVPFSYITCVTHPTRSNRGGRGSNRGSRTSLAPSNIHGEMSSSPAYSSMTSVVTSSSPISEGTRTGLQTGCDDIYETTPRNTPVGTNASTEAPTSSMVTPAATHGMEKSGKETNDKANLSGLTSSRVMPENIDTIQKSGKETIEEAPFSYITCVTHPTRSNRGGRGSNRGCRTSLAPSNIHGEMSSSPAYSSMTSVVISSSPISEGTGTGLHTGCDIYETTPRNTPVGTNATAEAPTSSMVTPAATLGMEKSGKETNDKANICGSLSSRVMPEDTHTIAKSDKETIGAVPFSYITCVTHPKRSNRGGRGSSRGGSTSFVPTNIRGEMSLTAAQVSIPSDVTSFTASSDDSSAKMQTVSDSVDITPRNTPVGPSAIGKGIKVITEMRDLPKAPTSSMVTPTDTHGMEKSGKETNDKANISGLPSSRVMPEDTHTIAKSGKETIEAAPFSYITCVTHPKRSNRGGRGSSRGSSTSFVPTNIRGEMSLTSAQVSIPSDVTSFTASSNDYSAKLQTGSDSGDITRGNTLVEPSGGDLKVITEIRDLRETDSSSTVYSTSSSLNSATSMSTSATDRMDAGNQTSDMKQPVISRMGVQSPRGGKEVTALKTVGGSCQLQRSSTMPEIPESTRPLMVEKQNSVAHPSKSIVSSTCAAKEVLKGTTWLIEADEVSSPTMVTMEATHAIESSGKEANDEASLSEISTLSVEGACNAHPVRSNRGGRNSNRGSRTRLSLTNIRGEMSLSSFPVSTATEAASSTPASDDSTIGVQTKSDSDEIIPRNAIVGMSVSGIDGKVLAQIRDSGEMSLSSAQVSATSEVASPTAIREDSTIVLQTGCHSDEITLRNTAAGPNASEDGPKVIPQIPNRVLQSGSDSDEITYRDAPVAPIASGLDLKDMPQIPKSVLQAESNSDKISPRSTPAGTSASGDDLKVIAQTSNRVLEEEITPRDAPVAPSASGHDLQDMPQIPKSVLRTGSDSDEISPRSTLAVPNTSRHDLKVIAQTPNRVLQTGYDSDEISSHSTPAASSPNGDDLKVIADIPNCDSATRVQKATPLLSRSTTTGPEDMNERSCSECNSKKKIEPVMPTDNNEIVPPKGCRTRTASNTNIPLPPRAPARAASNTSIPMPPRALDRTASNSSIPLPPRPPARAASNTNIPLPPGALARAASNTSILLLPGALARTASSTSIPLPPRAPARTASNISILVPPRALARTASNSSIPLPSRTPSQTGLSEVSKLNRTPTSLSFEAETSATTSSSSLLKERNEAQHPSRIPRTKSFIANARDSVSENNEMTVFLNLRKKLESVQQEFLQNYENLKLNQPENLEGSYKLIELLKDAECKNDNDSAKMNQPSAVADTSDQDLLDAKCAAERLEREIKELKKIHEAEMNELKVEFENELLKDNDIMANLKKQIKYLEMESLEAKSIAQHLQRQTEELKTIHATEMNKCEYEFEVKCENELLKHNDIVADLQKQIKEANCSAERLERQTEESNEIHATEMTTRENDFKVELENELHKHKDIIVDLQKQIKYLETESLEAKSIAQHLQRQTEELEKIHATQMTRREKEFKVEFEKELRKHNDIMANLQKQIKYLERQAEELKEIHATEMTTRENEINVELEKELHKHKHIIVDQQKQIKYLETESLEAKSIAQHLQRQTEELEKIHATQMTRREKEFKVEFEKELRKHNDIMANLQKQIKYLERQAEELKEIHATEMSTRENEINVKLEKELHKHKHIIVDQQKQIKYLETELLEAKSIAQHLQRQTEELEKIHATQMTRREEEFKVEFEKELHKHNDIMANLQKQIKYLEKQTEEFKEIYATEMTTRENEFKVELEKERHKQNVIIADLQNQFKYLEMELLEANCTTEHLERQTENLNKIHATEMTTRENEFKVELEKELLKHNDIMANLQKQIKYLENQTEELKEIHATEMTTRENEFKVELEKERHKQNVIIADLQKQIKYLETESLAAKSTTQHLERQTENLNEIHATEMTTRENEFKVELEKERHRQNVIIADLQKQIKYLETESLEAKSTTQHLERQTENLNEIHATEMTTRENEFKVELEKELLKHNDIMANLQKQIKYLEKQTEEFKEIHATEMTTRENEFKVELEKERHKQNVIIADLQKQIKYLETESLAAKSTTQHLERQTENLNEIHATEMTTRENEFKVELEKERHKQNVIIADLQKQIKYLETESLEAKSTTQHLERQTEELKKIHCTEMTSRENELKVEFEKELLKHNDIMADLQNEIKDLETSNQKSERQTKELKQIHATEMTTRENEYKVELEKELLKHKDLQKQIKYLETELLEAKSNTKHLERQKEELKKIHATDMTTREKEFKVVFDKEVLKHNDTMADLQKLNKYLETESLEAKGIIERLQSMMTKLKEDHAAELTLRENEFRFELERELLRRNDTMANLKKAIKSLEMSNHKLSEAKRTVGLLERQTEKLKEIHATEVTMRENEFKVELEKERHKHNDIRADLQKQLKYLETALLEANCTTKSLEIQIAELKAIYATEMTTRENEFKVELEKELLKHNDVMGDLQKQVKYLETELVEAKRTAEDLERETKELKDIHATEIAIREEEMKVGFEKRLLKNNEIITDLTKNIESLETAIENIRDLKEDFVCQLKEKVNQVTQLEITIQTMGNDLVTAQQKLEECHKAKTQVQDLNARITALEKTIKLKEMQLNEQNRLIEELEEEILRLTGTNKELRDQLTHVSQMLVAHNRVMKTLPEGGLNRQSIEKLLGEKREVCGDDTIAPNPTAFLDFYTNLNSNQLEVFRLGNEVRQLEQNNTQGHELLAKQEEKIMRLEGENARLKGEIAKSCQVLLDKQEEKILRLEGENTILKGELTKSTVIPSPEGPSSATDVEPCDDAEDFNPTEYFTSRRRQKRCIDIKVKKLNF